MMINIGYGATPLPYVRAQCHSTRNKFISSNSLWNRHNAKWVVMTQYNQQTYIESQYKLVASNLSNKKYILYNKKGSQYL